MKQNKKYSEINKLKNILPQQTTTSFFKQTLKKIAQKDFITVFPQRPATAIIKNNVTTPLSQITEGQINYFLKNETKQKKIMIANRKKLQYDEKSLSNFFSITNSTFYSHSLSFISTCNFIVKDKTIFFAFLQSLLHLIDNNNYNMPNYFISNEDGIEYKIIDKLFLTSTQPEPPHKMCPFPLFFQKVFLLSHKLDKVLHEPNIKYLRLNVEHDCTLFSKLEKLAYSKGIITFELSILYSEFYFKDERAFAQVVFESAQMVFNSMVSVKNIYIEFIVDPRHFNLKKIDKYMLFLANNRMLYKRYGMLVNIFIRISKYDAPKGHITEYVEQKLNFDKTLEFSLPLLCAKYGANSKIRKLHKMVLLKIMKSAIQWGRWIYKGKEQNIFKEFKTSNSSHGKKK